MAIEICKADGTVETIEIAIDGEQGAPSHEHDHAHNECMFCSSMAASKALTAPAPQLMAVIPARYLGNSGGLIIPQGLQAKHFQTTGPPAVIA